MPYIGNQGSVAGFVNQPSKQDLTGATGSTLTLTHAVSGPEDISLFINNVRQEPTTSYTATGTTVTLQGYTVAASDDIYVLYNGLTQLSSVPVDDSVSTAKIADNAITMAKLATSGTLPALNGSALTSVVGNAQVIAQLSMSADDNNLTEQQWNRAAFDVIDFDNYASTANVAKTSGVQSGAGFLVPVTGYYQVYFHCCLGVDGQDGTVRDSGSMISKYSGGTETVIASAHGRYQDNNNDIGQMAHFLSVIESLQANDEVVFRTYLNDTASNPYDVFSAAANGESHAFYPNTASDNSAMKRGTYCGILKVG
jgi:hypothetical protein|tara:strand:+ start:936 stop:1868 length:933 start_codon:yes stop_codon:yes gene_type:complete